MSKRVANSRSSTKARNNRLRYGWKTLRAAQNYEQLGKLLSGDLEDKLRAKYQAAKNTLKGLLPKRLLRRPQGR